MSRFIVAGPPCAGKSTYVRNSFKKGDLVYDYDTLHGALSGQGSHQHLDGIKPFVFAARDAVFDALEKRKEQAAWIITSTKSREALQGMAERFGAEIVFLDVSREEAHRRADLDGRPEAWHGYIDAWFDQADIDPGEYQKTKSGGGEMQKKVFQSRIKLKGEDSGNFSAVFSTLNVIDHDGDVTLPGAFSDGQKVRIAYWGHRWSDLPVGKGVIHADEKKAWVDGQFFLSTESGLQTYEVVKELEDLQEWSYGFEIIEQEYGKFEGKQVRFLKKLKVIEVSPVMQGAGIGTMTTAIKRAGGENASNDPRAVLAQIERDHGVGGDLSAPIMALAQIERELKAAPPSGAAGIPDNPRLALKQLQDQGGMTRAESIRRRIQAENPDHDETMVNILLESAVGAYAQQLYQQMEMSAGVVPDWSAAWDRARLWANEVI